MCRMMVGWCMVIYFVLGRSERMQKGNSEDITFRMASGKNANAFGFVFGFLVV